VTPAAPVEKPLVPACDQPMRATALTRTILKLTVLLFAIALSHPAAAKSSFRDCPDCPLMRIIPAGRFLMGSPDREPGRQAAEGPQHEVRFGRSFAIGVYDVTRREFSAFVRATGYQTNDRTCDWRAPKTRGHDLDQHDDEPVVCVSWSDADAFVDWLSKKARHRYRLPSEAEWEYAARAGTSSIRPWAGRDSRDFANYGSDQCCAPMTSGRDRWLYTSPVGSFLPDAFGLYDMLGNVWQRTEDCGHEDYTGAPANGSAWIKGGDCTTRILRGGAWFDPLDQLRVAARAADPADFRKNDIGFRVARSL
jgi:formylglycine-generating enzyme required for sulfatase activity